MARGGPERPGVPGRVEVDAIAHLHDEGRPAADDPPQR